MSNPIEVLRQAADIIEHVGHSTKLYEETDADTGKPACYCAYGAMTLAATNGRDACFSTATGVWNIRPAARAIAEVLNLHVDCGDYFTAVTGWNDTHSAGAVALGLRLAADQLERNTRNA